MKKFIFLLMAFFLLEQTLFAFVYTIDESHTHVGFKIKHLMFSSVSGQFKKHTGTFDFNPKTGELKDLKIDIPISSIDTNDNKRDEHLKGTDFFDMAQFPHLTFSVDAAKIKEKNQTTALNGDLLMHGVKKNIVLQVIYNGSMVDASGNEHIAFSASGQISRKDFGITWNKTLDKGGVALSDLVDIMIEGEAVFKKAVAVSSEKK